MVVLTDTVGFIRNMPADLFAAFRSTFEEAADADLIVEVIDASDPEHEQHLETTQRLLEELELGNRPRVAVYNKLDRLSAEERLAFDRPGQIGLSATDLSTLGPLLRAIASAARVRAPVASDSASV